MRRANRQQGSARPIPLVVRVGLGCAVLALAAGAYFWWGRDASPPRASRTLRVLPGLAGSKGEDWYRASLPSWQALDFVSLNDRDALTGVIRQVVDRRLEGPEIDPALLTRDIVAFFYALGAADPDEYLERLGTYRRLLTGAELAETAQLYGTYKALTGEDLTGAVETHDVLKVFWDANGAARRPAKLSTKGFVQVAQSKAVPSDLAPGSILAAVVWPSYSMFEKNESGTWLGPFSMGFPRLTVPLASFDDAMAKHGRLLMCNVLFVIRTERGEVFPLDLTFFFSPENERWYYELAGAGFPYELYWPL